MRLLSVVLCVAEEPFSAFGKPYSRCALPLHFSSTEESWSRRNKHRVYHPRLTGGRQQSSRCYLIQLFLFEAISAC